MKTYPTDAERWARIESLRALEAEITELAGHLNAGNYRFLKLIAEFDNRHGWSCGLTQSCAHWLNWKCGIDLGAAREKVRVAHALEKLPKVSTAMEQGRLSYSKVRALTRVATPESEDFLLMVALHGTASHVENLVRGYRRSKEAEELSREVRQQEKRGLTYQYDEDGSLVLKGRLPAEIGALFLKAIDTVTGNMIQADLEERKQNKPVVGGLSEKKPSYAARRADALGQIAESFLAHGAESLSGDKHQILVHVSAETLEHSVAGQCEIEHGPAIAAETARRLSCDASLIPVMEGDKGEVLNVGRKTRSIPSALKRALNVRDKGCRFPGCGNTRYVDGHHIKHWAQGGETKLSNLITLCGFHHRKVHEGGITIQILDDGAFRFVWPNGQPIPATAEGCGNPTGDWRQLTETHKQSGIHIDKNTAATLWRGEKMDYNLGVEVLFQQIRKANKVSAETSARPNQPIPF